MIRPDQRRKLAVIGPYPPYRGGIAHFTEQFHVHLESSGLADVTGVSFSRQYPGFLFPGKTQYAQDAVIQLNTQISIDSMNPMSWGKAARQLIGLEVDEVVFMYWMPFFAPAFVRMANLLKKQGITVSAIVHNASPHERQPLGSFLSHAFLSRCDRLIALSKAVKRDIEALGLRRPIDVNPHPVYNQFGTSIDKKEARHHLGLKETEALILFFGLVRKYKGLDILIQALGQTSRPVKLLVAGEWYEGRSEVDLMIKRLGLSDRIDIRDHYISDSDVKYFFSAADVVVQPYRNATQSGVVQTALQFGKPSIVTGVGGLPEMIEHGVSGWVVKPEDPKALAEAIDTFYEDDHAERLTLGAIRARDSFTWETFISNFLKD